MKTSIILLSLLSSFSINILAQDNALNAIDSIKSLMKTQVNRDKVSSLNELAWYYRNSDVDSALYFSNQAFFHAKEAQDDKAIASAYNSLASTHEALGNLDSAEFFHKNGIQIKIALKDSLGLASSYNNLGIVYDEMGKFDNSLQQYFLSLELYEQHSEHEYDIAMVLGNIGIVYKKQKSYKKVLEYYEKALSIYEGVESKFGETITNGNIGSLLINMKRFEESIVYSKKALQGYQELSYIRYIPYSQHNIAIANDSLMNYSIAEDYYKLATVGHLEHQNFFELSSALNSFSNSYLLQKKYEHALAAANKAKAYAIDVNATDLEIDAVKLAAIAYNGLKDYENAFTNLTEHHIGKDSLFSLERTRTIEELQTKYETTEKEKQLIVQNRQLSEQESTIVMNQVIMICLILVLISIVVITLLTRSRLRKKQELLLQQKELDYRALQLNAVIDSQEKERKRFATDLHDGFGQLISVLKMNVSAIKQDNASLEKKNELFEKSTEILNGMYDELRGICFNLMPHTLVQEGLVAALREFSGRINLSGKVTVEVMVFDFEDRLDDLKEISLYRIVQEWVNNILKYGNANSITIQLTRDEEELTLTVEDNGRGFDKELLTEGKGNGWKNMNSRANLIKGDLEIDTSPGLKGSTLIINIPYQTVEKSKESYATAT
jgi:signal transduction histidine kinase